MTSALLWIFLPALVGIGLLFYRQSDFFPMFVAGAVCLFLTWVAWQIPVDVVLQLGPLSIEIAPSFALFGRSLTLGDAMRPLLVFIYLFETLWIFGSFFAHPNRLFIPLGLICVSLLVAALSVDPFLYAALLIAMAALLLIPLLAPPGKAFGRGVLRFLKFQIFAIPFILFTGWILTGVEANPGNLNLVLRAGGLLILGFIFLLALFPFHSWGPMLAAESHPYVFGFLLFFLPTTASVFALGFFDRYLWLRDSEFAHPVILLTASLAILLAGLWAAFERNPHRIFAYACMLTTGFGLQAIGLGGQGVEAYFALLLPHALAIWVWAVALGVAWKNSDELQSLDTLRNNLSSKPVTKVALFLAIFSIAGLPLLGSFPGRLALLSGSAEVSPWAAAGSIVGNLGFLFAAVRVLLALLPSTEAKKKEWVEEVEQAGRRTPVSDAASPYAWAFLAVAAVGLLGFGLFSRLFLAAIPGLAAMFSQLVP